MEINYGVMMKALLSIVALLLINFSANASEDQQSDVPEEGWVFIEDTGSGFLFGHHSAAGQGEGWMLWVLRNPEPIEFSEIAELVAVQSYQVANCENQTLGVRHDLLLEYPSSQVSHHADFSTNIEMLKVEEGTRAELKSQFLCQSDDMSEKHHFTTIGAFEAYRTQNFGMLYQDEWVVVSRSAGGINYIRRDAIGQGEGWSLWVGLATPIQWFMTDSVMTSYRFQEVVDCDSGSLTVRDTIVHSLPANLFVFNAFDGNRYDEDRFQSEAVRSEKSRWYCGDMPSNDSPGLSLQNAIEMAAPEGAMERDLEDWVYVTINETTLKLIRVDAIGAGQGWVAELQRLPGSNEWPDENGMVSTNSYLVADCLTGNVTREERRFSIFGGIPLTNSIDTYSGIVDFDNANYQKELLWLCEGAQRRTGVGLSWEYAVSGAAFLME